MVLPEPFGPRKPEISPLATRMSTVTNRIARPNPLGPEQSWCLRFLRSFYWRLDRVMPKGWSKGTSDRWKQTIEDRVHGYYAQSNRRTAEVTGFDLRSMGYDLGE